MHTLSRRGVCCHVAGGRLSSRSTDCCTSIMNKTRGESEKALEERRKERSSDTSWSRFNARKYMDPRATITMELEVISGREQFTRRRRFAHGIDDSSVRFLFPLERFTTPSDNEKDYSNDHRAHTCHFPQTRITLPSQRCRIRMQST